MNKVFLVVSFFALALATENISPTLNLDTSFQAALRQSETMADQQEQLLQAEEHYSQGLSAMLPNVNANALFFSQDTADLNLASGVTSPQANQTTTRLNATWPIFRGFRDFAALAQNQQLITAQKEAYQWAALQLYQDTAQAFYLVVSLENDRAILEKEVRLYKQRIGELQDRVAIGRSRQTEVLTVQVSLATLEAQLEQAKAQVVAARELLGFITGTTITAVSDAQVVPRIAEPLAFYVQKIAQRPDIIAADARIAATSKNIDIATGAFLPAADVGANYYLQRPTGTLKDSHWDAQMAITIPLFSGSTNFSKVTEAQSQVRQAQLAKDRLQRLAEQNIRTTYQQYLYDVTQITAYQKAAQLAEKNYQAVAQDYNLGLDTNIDVLQALVTYQEAQRSLNRAQAAAKTDWCRLTALTATVPMLTGAK